MKWVSNLPQGDDIPYPFITDEPDLKTMARYFRTSDYVAMTGFATVFPGALYALGRSTLRS
ncbi:hypothetical protein BATDEDRAFT_92288 [Batrachochytrium dendrobatidis JAM81]|uniref:NADH-ubiquinone oxidoreductase 21kDa subunit N-terminal domain-containing protein n=1 Tax=Batrachochytrium dendrobatidis (strain JAM81 / FGSC 10211) TaxID=684364 RepID=F4PCT0_BATDJ|nr:uncharacterized protein BATDEDRAFT_92288 [Batrachochytrium dendrobatidis JAM81]EGF76883.1 hypothetical protein BATDEDRAFT_92288 [Batrachochytrium dendrobatidis JAM81]|eukprot:XP_006682488.1 hypothetical protein BATDEDRAFT_92288 [Batrachochytrium dendrobatidis JAM81]